MNNPQKSIWSSPPAHWIVGAVLIMAGFLIGRASVKQVAYPPPTPTAKTATVQDRQAIPVRIIRDGGQTDHERGYAPSGR